MSFSESEELEALASYPEQQCLDRHRKIGRGWKIENNPYNTKWGELKTVGRLFLLEVACSPDSLLSSEVEKQFGPGSAMRCSLYNGYDLTTNEGISKIFKVIDELHPCHIWISCDCGPFSPLQRLNKKTPEQIQQLETKQEYAIKEYQGGVAVADHGKKRGSEIHWELSERCEAWKLPLIQSFLQDHQLQRVTTHGCSVNLRAHDTGDLMCKGWTIATKNANLLRHMHLPCQKNHRKVACEQGRPSTSAFYTTVFAKKVVEALRAHEVWSTVCEELSAQVNDVSSSSPEETTEACAVNRQDTSTEEKSRILKLVKHIHSTSGHGSIEVLLKALQKRGVPQHVLDTAKTFSCPICDERKRVAPRRPATLEVIPQKWQVVQSDMGSWHHPQSKDKCKFILFIDEGCRFRSGKVIFENSRQMATWPLVKQVFEEHWLAHFGQPEVLRVDPEGVWRDTEASDWCATKGIQLDTIPAEAHWQIGIVENAIKQAKAVMTALAEEYHDMSLTELFSRALWACNSKDNHLGYSPLQHAMGRSPDEWGKLHDSRIQGYPIHPQEHADGGFKDTIQAMSIAEQAFSKFQAEARIARATAAGQRPMKSFCPGDLVFFWRKQVPGGQGKGFSWSGQFVGPARVLAVETRVEEDGSLRPGSVVWLHHAGRLLKAAPEQLRAASEREQAIEQLQGPLEVPWTITSLATHPGRKTYHDISKDLPTDDQFQEAANHPTGGRRFTGKKRGVDSEAPAGPALRQRQADFQQMSDLHVTSENTKAVQPAFEIAIDLPTSKRGLKRFCDSPEAFVASQLRRQTVEVRERNLTDEELIEFRGAKGKEVKNYIQSHCFKLLPPESQNVDAVGMRWVLTWKCVPEENSRRAKARCVILGYQDKSYEFKPTSSPTLSKAGRQAFLIFCTQMNFRVEKGDVSSAFLQGDILEDGLNVVPTPEICEALGIPAGSVTKLQRAAYGLVEAPLWWYKSVWFFDINRLHAIEERAVYLGIFRLFRKTPLSYLRTC